MRASTIVSFVIVAVVAGFIGHVIRIGGGGPGPIDDHNPVGFTLSTPTPAPNGTAPASSITITNPGNGCSSGKTCYVTMNFVRTNPAACVSGDTASDCNAPICPPKGECVLFSGPATITHIDPKQRHHSATYVPVSGMIVLQSP